MYQVLDKPEMTEVKMALEYEKKVTPQRLILFMFWGLILVKCIMAEWAINYYSMPINSIYVWLPTLIFGFIATWVYFESIVKGFMTQPLVGRYVAKIWAGCAVAITIVGIVGTGLNAFSIFLLPAFFSIIIGLGYFCYSAVDQRLIFKYCAGVWWIGSVGLFYCSNVNSFFWFSILIFCNQVVPSIYLLVLNNKIVFRSAD